MSSRRDADRPNVELARIAGLSPAATLNRVRRLKESGVIEGIHAKLDREAAGFGLCVYVSVTLGRHEEALERRFEKVVAELPAGDGRRLGGGGDRRAARRSSARDLAELQHVLVALVHARAAPSASSRSCACASSSPTRPLPLGESRRLR